jgi:hypothetical protein
MKIKITLFALVGLSFLAGLAVTTSPMDLISTGKITSHAEARIGRPMTPGSVAGVARRTTRRAYRRGAYYGALPGGCPRATVYGYAVWSCGGVYYQSSGSGYVVIYF